MNNIYINSALFVYLVFFLSCSTPEKKQVQDSKKKDKNIEWLLGKSINSIDSILDVQKKENGFVVYLFNYHDCGNCIDAGFYISKKIDDLHCEQTVYAIASMISNPSNYQQKMQYDEYIYVDEQDKIRRELKYIPTPVLLLLDSHNTVKDVFFPKDTLNNHYNDFIKSCKYKI
jgi:hypothetical protein